MPARTRAAAAQVRTLKERYAAMNDTITTILSEILTQQNHISSELASLRGGLGAVKDVLQSSVDRLNVKSELIDTHTIKLTQLEDRCMSHCVRLDRLNGIADDYRDYKQRLKGGWWLIMVGAAAGAGILEVAGHVLSMVRR